MSRKMSYKASVERLLDLGIDLECLMFRIIKHEMEIKSGYKERYWYATLNKDTGHVNLSVVHKESSSCFRLQDLAKYRYLTLVKSL